MNHADFGDSLTFPLAPPSAWQFWVLVKYLQQLYDVQIITIIKSLNITWSFAELSALMFGYLHNLGSFIFSRQNMCSHHAVSGIIPVFHLDFPIWKRQCAYSMWHSTCNFIHYYLLPTQPPSFYTTNWYYTVTVSVYLYSKIVHRMSPIQFLQNNQNIFCHVKGIIMWSSSLPSHLTIFLVVALLSMKVYPDITEHTLSNKGNTLYCTHWQKKYSDSLLRYLQVLLK